MITGRNDITTAIGNTVRIKISLDCAGGFSLNDKAVLKVRKRNHAVVLTKILDIIEDAVFFTITPEESKLIPSGDHRWDITIYFNAKVENGVIMGDEVITPFYNAKFDVKRQASREVD